MTSNELHKLVILGLAAIVAGLIIVDSWIIAAHGEELSVSMTIYTLSRNYPAIPFFAGILIAHLFKL